MSSTAQNKFVFIMLIKSSYYFATMNFMMCYKRNSRTLTSLDLTWAEVKNKIFQVNIYINKYLFFLATNIIKKKKSKKGQYDNPSFSK